MDKFFEKVFKMREAQKELQRLMYCPDDKLREELREKIKKCEYDVDVMLHGWKNEVK